MLIIELELILTFCLKYSGESPSRCKIFSSRSASLLYTSHGTGLPRHDQKSNKIYVYSLNFTTRFQCTVVRVTWVLLQSRTKESELGVGVGRKVIRFHAFNKYLGHNGWYSGDNTRLPSMWPEFDSGPVPCGVEFVVGFRLQEFFSRFFVFFPPNKTSPNSTRISIEEPHENLPRLM